jgi:hypothetical protein
MMFTRKVITMVELSDESKQAITRLDSDIKALETLMAELVGTAAGILRQLSAEIISAVPTSEDEEIGIQVFATETFPDSPPSERRSGPFNRRPRSEQVSWLLSIMESGKWYDPYSIAKQYSGDEREFRYLRGAISGRFREMREEGIVERRDSNRRGSMFEYRKVA